MVEYSNRKINRYATEKPENCCQNQNRNDFKNEFQNG